MAIDWDDPCARAIELKRVYYALLSGGGVQMIRAKGPNTDREVRYHKNDTGSVRSEWWRAEDECRALQGLPPLRRRFAITAGSRRVF